MSRKLPALLAAALALGACGNDAGSRVGEIKKAIAESAESQFGGDVENLSDEERKAYDEFVDCMANGIDSKMSDEAIDGIINDRDSYQPSAEDMEASLEIVQECVGSAYMPAPESAN
ncbi:hypothetical protein J2S70_001017 [Trueperella bonasi]|uniref:Lipoprotein n=1 Tax=Trueperella bonasi TaxID=312286 RepID=A0ABT9NGA5_9ACTO|nr:hypothetical protein [Trueperella bonasi]MDP9806435.1 hypothetical protein [Trueperella bonasi]